MREAFGERFDVPDGYLATASVGVPPQGAVRAVRAALDDWATGGARPAAYDEPVETARAAFGALTGYDAADVAIGGSASALLGLVAAAVPDGARVVTAVDEFTSATFPFAAHADRGITVREVPLKQLGAAAVEAEVVVVSVVQSLGGAQVDLAPLRAAAAGGTLVVLDVTQAAGWRPLDLGWADAVVAGGYKWLLCPRGAAWMATSSRLRERMRPLVANWYAGGDERWSAIYGLPLRLSPDARRYDASPAWWCHVGAAVTLPWLASLDLGAVREHCVRLADATLDGLGLEPQGSAIVSLDRPGAFGRLTDAGVVAASRGGRTRLAFHLYNDASDVDRVLSALR